MLITDEVAVDTFLAAIIEFEQKVYTTSSRVLLENKNLCINCGKLKYTICKLGLVSLKWQWYKVSIA